MAAMLTWLVCVLPVLVLGLARTRAVYFSEPGRLGEEAAGDQVTRHYKSSTEDMECLNCQALVPIPVQPNPNPKPKAVQNQKVQLGLGLTLESHGPPPPPTTPPITFNHEGVL